MQAHSVGHVHKEPAEASHGEAVQPASATASHAHACDCAGHRRQQQAAARPDHGVWATLLPLVACAFCPACLSLWATILSALGVGFALSESQHRVALLVAVGVALGAGLWRARITQRLAPLGLSALGCALLLLHEFWLERGPLLVCAIALLLASTVLDHLQKRWAASKI